MGESILNKAFFGKYYFDLGNFVFSSVYDTING